MDAQFKVVLTGIVVVIFLIVLKFTVFTGLFHSDAIIPGVTDHDIFIRIESNSSLGEYITSDEFMRQVSRIHIESRSELYATNETTGDALFNACKDSLIAIGMEEGFAHKYRRENRYVGVFRNDTTEIVFHIFEGNNLENHIGYSILLATYRTMI